jgi:hypothetical protein
MDTLDLGSRRELMVDDFLIEEMEGAELRLQHPRPGDGDVLQRDMGGIGLRVRDGLRG